MLNGLLLNLSSKPCQTFVRWTSHLLMAVSCQKLLGQDPSLIVILDQSMCIRVSDAFTWKWKLNVPVIPVGHVGTWQVIKSAESQKLCHFFPVMLSSWVMHQENSTPVWAYSCIKWYKDVRQLSLVVIYLKDLIYQMSYVSIFLIPYPWQLSRWGLICYFVGKWDAPFERDVHYWLFSEPFPTPHLGCGDFGVVLNFL